MFFCNKHLGMYEPVTVRSHDAILGQYFCAVICCCCRQTSLF